MTFRADKLSPPKVAESAEEAYRWRYRVFELLNGIQSILATTVETTPVGVITGTDLNTVVGQINTLIISLQAADTALTAADAANVAAAALAYAPIAKGVTGGNSHNHTDGAGGTLDHVNLSNIGTNTHAQIDTKIADLTALAEHADNAAALLAGLAAGKFYRTGDIVKVVH